MYPMYPSYQPAYRTVRGPHGVTYMVHGGAAPWPEPPALYHELATPSPPPAAWCRCPDQGKDSVRGRGARCRTCGKSRAPQQGRGARQRPRLPQGAPEGALVRSASTAWEPRPRPAQSSPGPGAGPRDPYDYIRRTRLRADDWDNYWEGGRHTPSPGRESLGRSGGERRGARLTPPSRHSSTPSPREERGRGEGRRAVPEMEDEDSQPESKPITATSPPAKERSPTPVEAAPSPPPSPGEEERAPTPEEPRPTVDSQLSASLLADLVTMKSKMSAAELRYRKFQRRNPLRKLSLQIDEVIMEEDEEALEEDGEEKASLSSSDDELGLGKFRQVVGGSNLAEEILSEIYGSAGEGGVAARRSLAEEILEELYGSSGGQAGGREEEVEVQEEEEAEEANTYCTIEDVDLEERGTGGTG